jgi:hypothetical protein
VEVGEKVRVAGWEMVGEARVQAGVARGSEEEAGGSGSAALAAAGMVRAAPVVEKTTLQAAGQAARGWAVEVGPAALVGEATVTVAEVTGLATAEVDAAEGKAAGWVGVRIAASMCRTWRLEQFHKQRKHDKSWRGMRSVLRC